MILITFCNNTGKDDDEEMDDGKWHDVLNEEFGCGWTRLDG